MDTNELGPYTLNPDTEQIMGVSRHDLYMYRTKVPGGWLVTTKYTGYKKGGVTQEFIADPTHRWVVEGAQLLTGP